MIVGDEECNTPCSVCVLLLKMKMCAKILGH